MPAAAVPQEESIQVEAPAPRIVQPLTKNAKVKGTWTMYFGLDQYDFVDGHRYDLPMDLYQYLVSRGNIYDTL